MILLLVRFVKTYLLFIIFIIIKFYIEYIFMGRVDSIRISFYTYRRSRWMLNLNNWKLNIIIEKFIDLHWNKTLEKCLATRHVSLLNKTLEDLRRHISRRHISLLLFDRSYVGSLFWVFKSLFYYNWTTILMIKLQNFLTKYPVYIYQN